MSRREFAITVAGLVAAFAFGVCRTAHARNRMRGSGWRAGR